MQLRQIPVVKLPKDSPELDEEAEWIFRHAFCKGPISNQTDGDASRKKGPGMVPKIKKTLEYMRCENFEVPFIAFYRKEYTHPELNINDLWRIYKFDEKVIVTPAAQLWLVILCPLLCSGASLKLERKILHGCSRKCAITRQTNLWKT
jgi:Helix-turn-helix DNA-binding domain of SPT6